MTIERRNESREERFNTTEFAAPIRCVSDLETLLATAKLDELWGSLRPGESLVTAKFLDERITVGKEYEVRAIGENRYAKFIGRLKRIKPSYGWILTFEDVKYISSDASLAPVADRALATVFPKEASFMIYSDSPPSGYGLQDVQYQPACTQISKEVMMTAMKEFWATSRPPP